MSNPYEEGSIAWSLHESGDMLDVTCAVGDEPVNATDRQTVATYKIGAALIAALEDLSDAVRVGLEESD